MVEVVWDDIDEVKEIIADIRDGDCDLRWVIFGYEDTQMKKIVVVEAGDTGLDDLVSVLEKDKIFYVFFQVEPEGKVFALFQWLPSEANGMAKARASIHRSFVTSILGNVSIDIVANSKDDITQAKIDEAMHYMRATQGQALSDDDAMKKREGEEKRKEELAKQRAMAGNTKEANQRLASLSGGASIQSTGHLERASGTNISTRQQAKSESQALFESAKVDIVLEDENNLRELILDLKEPDREDYDEYNWMIIGYVQDKKNALELVETGNDTREGVADYIKAELGGGLDRVMYLLLKEDNAVQKITFISWMGKNVPALKRANATTHRGAIVSWISSIVQSRQEEHVSCCAELLGLKDEEAEEVVVQEGDKVDNVKELEERISSKPYLGKVLSDVQREKTPHEQWLERKEALAKGGGVIAKVSSGDTSILNDSSAVGSPDFTRVQLKNNDTERSLRKGVGRSKFAQRSRSDRELDRSTGEADCDSTRSKPTIENASKAELREMMRKAEEEAAKLAEEAERRKEEMRKLQQAMVDADSPSKSHGGDDDGREEEQAMSPGELEGQKRARKAEEEEEKEKERAVREEAAKVKAEEEAQAKQEAVEREQEEARRRKEEEEAKAAKEREEARAKEEEERKEQEKTAAAAAAAAAAEEEKARAAKEREEKEREEKERKNREEAAAAAAAAAAASEAAARKEAEEKEAADAKKKAEEEEKRAAALAEEEAREARLAAARKAQEEARVNAEKEIAARREANEAKGDGSGMATRKAELLAEADSSKRSEEDAIRKKAEELLARKKALLEEAARKQSMGAPSPARSPLAGQDGNQDRDRLKRAEEFRQRKMAELASRKGGDVDAASKKAAFLREAEEAVRRAAQQENTKKRDDDKRRITSMPVATGSLTAALSDDSDESEATPGNTPSKNMAKPMRA